MPKENPKQVSLPHLQDKLQFLKDSISEVEGQLRRRKSQKQGFLSEIAQQICEVRNSIHYLNQMGDVQNNLLSRRRINLDRQIKALEQEKRQQELEYWRDINALQKELRELRKEYRATRVGAECMIQKKY